MFDNYTILNVQIHLLALNSPTFDETFNAEEENQKGTDPSDPFIKLEVVAYQLGHHHFVLPGHALECNFEVHVVVFAAIIFNYLIVALQEVKPGFSLLEFFRG